MSGFEDTDAGFGLESEASWLPEGTVLEERWRITGRLGRGGFATVYSAEHLKLGRNAAVKVLDLRAPAHELGMLHERFLREAKLAASLEHPNVVQILDYGLLERDGHISPFIVMELLRGHDLEAELLEHGPLDAERAKRLFHGALDALRVSHEAGVVHRDLKPSNLFIMQPGEDAERMIVVDFGIARVFDDPNSKLTATNQFMGTPAYLAPEYIETQETTPAVDVYQMGLIIGESLTGTPVVQASSPMGFLVAHCGGQQRLPDALRGSALGDVLERAVSVDPAGRYPDAGALRVALDEISWSGIAATGGMTRDEQLAHTLPGTPPDLIGERAPREDMIPNPTLSPPPRAPARSPVAVAVGVGVLLLGGVALGAVMLVRPAPPRAGTEDASKPPQTQQPPRVATSITTPPPAPSTNNAPPTPPTLAPTTTGAGSTHNAPTPSTLASASQTSGQTANTASAATKPTTTTATKPSKPSTLAAHTGRRAPARTTRTKKRAGGALRHAQSRRPAAPVREPIELLKPQPIDAKLAKAMEAYREVAGDINKEHDALMRRVEKHTLAEPGQVASSFLDDARYLRRASSALAKAARHAPATPSFDRAATALASTTKKLSALHAESYVYRNQRQFKQDPERIKSLVARHRALMKEFRPRRAAFVKALYQAQEQTLAERFAKTSPRTSPRLHHFHGALLESVRALRAAETSPSGADAHVRRADRHREAYAKLIPKSVKDDPLRELLSSSTVNRLNAVVKRTRYTGPRLGEIHKAKKKARTLYTGAHARHAVSIAYANLYMSCGIYLREYFRRRLS